MPVRAADALLFDLGRVVIDIDFARAFACWAGHARCEPRRFEEQFRRDVSYRQHEVGEIDTREYFGVLKAAFDVDMSYDQFIEGWNAIFIGEMPGMAELLKPDAPAYDHVVKAIGVPAERIVFFDDVIENVEGARTRGLQAVHVRSSADVAHALNALGL